MAHIVFDLSCSESRSRFRDLAIELLGQRQPPITVDLIDELRDQANALRLAAPDYHAIMIELLRESGGCGFSLSDTAICCPACNAVQNQVAWLCAVCGGQMVVAESDAEPLSPCQQQPAIPAPATATTPQTEAKLMSATDYLKELQDLEQQQGAGRIATIAVQFFATLDRLPHLKREVDAICQPRPGVNYDDLAASIEQRLDKAANLLARFDLLPREIRQSPEVVEIVHGLQNAMTLRTIDTWAVEFDGKCTEVRQRITRERSEAERTEQQPVQEGADAGYSTEDQFYTDPMTGLQWAHEKYIRASDYDTALTFVSSLNIGGLTGWRLPTRGELNFVFSGDLLRNIQGQQKREFRSSTNQKCGSSEEDHGFRYYVKHPDNFTNGCQKHETKYFWPVRSGGLSV